MKKIVLLFSFLLFSFPSYSRQYQATPETGVAMHGKPRSHGDFISFDYANPDAPKGGTLKMSAFGNFDTFNPYTIKGVSAAGSAMMFDTLMVESADEPFSLYGLIAQTVEMPDDRSWVAFNINPKAKFSDEARLQRKMSFFLLTFFEPRDCLCFVITMEMSTRLRLKG